MREHVDIQRERATETNELKIKREKERKGRGLLLTEK